MSTTAEGKLRTLTPKVLIRQASENPPEPIIDGLQNVGDILLLHGTEESFKSVLVVQMAESIAVGTRFLRIWDVPRPRTVGIIETEMHEAMLGTRLSQMFPDGNAPERMCFLGADVLRDWRRLKTLAGKFQLIREWIEQEGIEVLLIDTANDFFRGDNNPSDESIVGSFFDEVRNLDTKACILVRHDRKRRTDDIHGGSSNEQIRGSSEW